MREAGGARFFFPHAIERETSFALFCSSLSILDRQTPARPDRTNEQTHVGKARPTKRASALETPKERTILFFVFFLRLSSFCVEQHRFSLQNRVSIKPSIANSKSRIFERFRQHNFPVSNFADTMTAFAKISGSSSWKRSQPIARAAQLFRAEDAARRRCLCRPAAAALALAAATTSSAPALPPLPPPLLLSLSALPHQRPERRLRTGTRTHASSSSPSSPSPSSLEAKLGALASSAASSFPWLLLAAASLALLRPSLFLWFEPHVTAALALTMATMGSTLTPEDFRIVASKPRRVALGALLQFTLMPLAGLAVSRLLCSASRADAVGICMVAACPGGVASHVVAVVARAAVPLSVAMTATSTLAATIATPLLARLLLGAVVPVDGLALLRSTASVVLAPVALGAAAAAAFPKLVRRFAPFAPLVAVAATVAVCGTVIARSAEVLLASLRALVNGLGGGASAAASSAAGGSMALPAAVLLHLLGFASGYFVSKHLCGLPEKQARTNSIEVCVCAQSRVFFFLSFALHSFLDLL